MARAQVIFASQPHLWRWVNELPGAAGVRLFTEWAQELQSAADQMDSLGVQLAASLLSLLQHLNRQHVRAISSLTVWSTCCLIADCM